MPNALLRRLLVSAAHYEEHTRTPAGPIPGTLERLVPLLLAIVFPVYLQHLVRREEQFLVQQLRRRLS